ncbi:MAG: TlpA disulfide reductase family protein [Acidobacteriaceae bacterium]|jgi:thiol-disulfide isomerase/thioredoxin
MGKAAEDVMRKAALVVAMAAGFGLVVWSGVENLRARRLEMQRQEQERVDLLPGAADGAGSGVAGGSGGGNGAAGETPTEKEAGDSPLKGKAAPEFSLEDLSGKKVSLSDFKGRPLVVNFWGTYCAPCKIEMPWLEEFEKKYAGSGFEVLGVTYDAEVGKETITKNVQRLGVTYPILLSNAQVEKTYLSDSEVLPMSFYVDKAGKVVDVTAGLGSKDELEGMVKETIGAGGR